MTEVITRARCLMGSAGMLPALFGTLADSFDAFRAPLVQRNAISYELRNNRRQYAGGCEQNARAPRSTSAIGDASRSF